MYYSCYFLLLFTLSTCGKSVSEQQNSKEIKFTVAHYKMPCVGEDMQLCYWVSKDGREFEYFYDEIEGFDYQWGYQYELLIHQKKKENRMLDASEFRYELRQELAKNHTDKTFQLPSIFDGQKLITLEKEQCSYMGMVPIYTASFSCEDLEHSEQALFRYENNGLLLLETE